MTVKMVAGRRLLTLVTNFILILAFFKRCHANVSYGYSQGSHEDFVKDVHIIFMNHLDVGYNGVAPKVGFINNVLNTYFTEHFPRALNISRQLKDGGYTETFRYTTHPWLLRLYLHCPEDFKLNNITLKCPSKAERSAMISALQSRVVTYHAGPMNMQPENMNEMLFELSLNISNQLDAELGFQREFKTLSQRDVPGMTKAVIPILARKDVVAVSVGVNDGTSPPAVPKIFNWQFDDQNSVIAMWHKGGYPDNPGPDPAHPGGLSRDDCVVMEDCPVAMCFAFRTDNSGPPETVQEVLGYYEILRKQFPNARLHASEFGDFVAQMTPYKHKLPVITGEIGDTWISGISSDPKKLAQYRAVTRVLTDCIQKGACDPHSDDRITDAVFNLVKLGEHTWGLPGVYDTVNWTNQAFSKARSGQNYRNCEQAWREQRRFVQTTVDSLQSHPILPDIKQALQDLTPKRPDLTGYQAVDMMKVYNYTDGTEIQFAVNGAIQRLYDYRLKKNWAASGNFGQFVYRTYDAGDFNVSHRYYPYKWKTFFQKPNLTRNGDAVSRQWQTILDELYKSDEGFKFVAKIVLDYVPSLKYGAPREVWVSYDYHDYGTGEPGLDITLQWFEKQATRTPESLMFYFSPVPPPPPVSSSPAHQPRPQQSRSSVVTEMGGENEARMAHGNDPQNGNTDTRGTTAGDKDVLDYNWKLRKLGSVISADSVVLNGSQYLHAVDSDVFYTTDEHIGLQFHSRDTPLISLGTVSHAPSPFPVPLAPVQQGTITGFAYNLYNNMWDTNYVLWYPFVEEDTDFKARFTVSFLHYKDQQATSVVP